MRKYISLSLILDLQNYTRSLKNWQEIYATAHPTVPRQTFFQHQFDHYIEIIKPIIYPSSLLEDLRKVPNLAFYTEDLTETQVDRLTKSINVLKEWEILVGKPELQPGESCIVGLSDIMLAEPVSTRSPITKVVLHEKPQNYELSLWGTCLPVPPITIRSPVIHSKKIASTTLGMPTANFRIDHTLSTLLLPYPNGIYIGVFRFTTSPDTVYRCVCSLGINMHYENEVWSRKFEAYVDHEFEGEFYGEEAEVEIRKLIRLEGLFKSFDGFLCAMSNDIWVGKHAKI